MSTSSDGTWHNFGLLQVANGLTAYDAVHDRLLSIGGSRTDDWALPLSGVPAWSYLPPPQQRVYFAFGGSTFDPDAGIAYGSSFDALGLEIITLDPATGAITMPPASGPRPSTDLVASLILDAAAHRLLLVGIIPASGYSQNLPEVWVFDLLPSPTWSKWSPSGNPSTALDASKAMLDPVRHRLLFADVYDAATQQITTLDLDTRAWGTFPTNGLPGGVWNDWAYDAVSDQVWTVDSQGEAYSLSMSTLQWSLAASAGAGPSPRIRAGVAIDPSRHRLMVTGGETSTGSDIFNDTWALSLDGAPAWANLAPPVVRPEVRGGASDGYDAVRGRMILFGGASSLGMPLNDAWALDLGPSPTWSQIITQGTPPPGRYWHAAAWDEGHDRYVVFGGYNQVVALGDLWTLSFASGMPTWAQIVPPGPAPSARFLSQLVRDPLRDRFLLFFGGTRASVLGEVWELKLDPAPAWRLMSPAGIGPSARDAMMCVYDPDRDRVLVFGGGGMIDLDDDMFALSLGSGDGSWQQLYPATPPSARNESVMRLDAPHHRLLLYGGFGIDSTATQTVIDFLGDTWSLPLTEPLAWHQLSPAGPQPDGRDRANGVYDPNYDRFIITCGYISGLNDTWGLYFGGAPTPTQLALATSDVSAGRVRLMWAGADPGAQVHAYRRVPDGPWRSLTDLAADGTGYVTLEDRDVTAGATLEYRIGIVGAGGERYSGITRVQIPRLSLTLAAHGLEGRVAFTIELASGDPARLELFDLAGRRVWSRDVGSLGAGSHEIAAEGARVTPALYFARLKQGAETRFARVVLVR